MATPVQLLTAIASATGVPLPTVVDIDRKLVEGGLRTKGGRGRSAAHMTALDAARLLTAILASPQANTSVEAVERYGQTHPDKTRSSDTSFGAVKLDDLAGLRARHSFVDALEALIASASSGSLAKLINNPKENWAPHIEVFAFTRATRGRIRIAGLPKGLTVSLEYVSAPGDGKSLSAKKTGRKRGTLAEETAGDLEQSRRVTEQTILAIAKLLAGESQHDRA